MKESIGVLDAVLEKTHRRGWSLLRKSLQPELAYIELSPYTFTAAGGGPQF